MNISSDENFTQGCQSMVIRQVNAHNNFIDIIKSIVHCSSKDAYLIFDVYKKHKMIKYDAGIGRWSVTHGLFLEKESLCQVLSAIRVSTQ